MTESDHINVEYQYIGKIDYSDAVQMMGEKIPQASQEGKAYWWGLEHNRVYTCGLATAKEHIISPDLYTIPSRRGGSVTVHNPGQLVFYSVFPLVNVQGGLQAYIRFLEGSIIETLWEYQVLAFQLPPYSGVWTPRGKIAFVGLGLKGGVIYHGVAINLLNDLNDYDPIHSCGIQLPIVKLEDEVNIKGEQIRLNPQNLLEDFSLRLKRKLESRFTKKGGAEFRDYLKEKQTSFPEKALAFRLGQLFFNERRYWEAHEAWEVFWREYSSGEFKRFLGGLIQLASGLYKLILKPNLKGAYSLLKKALEKLENNIYVDQYILPLKEQLPLREYIAQNIKNIEEMMSSEGSVSKEKIQEKRSEIFLPYILANKFDTMYFPR